MINKSLTSQIDKWLITDLKRMFLKYSREKYSETCSVENYAKIWNSRFLSQVSVGVIFVYTQLC